MPWTESPAEGNIHPYPPAWNDTLCQEEQNVKKQQDIVSLCSPSIQQYERQMYFYWADYPRAHCPTVRDAYAWAPLSTVAERWVMFMTFSDFLSPSQFCTSCIVGQWSGEFNASWQPLFILLQESSKIHHQIKRCNTQILAFVKWKKKKSCGNWSHQDPL